MPQNEDHGGKENKANHGNIVDCKKVIGNVIALVASVSHKDTIPIEALKLKSLFNHS
jgi:hypothetical protein